jgi:hypothetical protein
MGRKLVVVVCVESSGTGHILETTIAVKPQGDKLAEYAEGVGLLPAD